MATAQMIAQLREAFGKHERMSDASYEKLAAILDRADRDALKAAVEARIKFVTPLARNRYFKRYGQWI